MQIQKPPKSADKLLSWLCKQELLEEILGDLHANFNRTYRQHGKWRSSIRYWFQVLHFVRPFALKKTSILNPNPCGMFKNNFKIAVRNTLKHKSYATINLFGLAIGLAAFAIIVLYVYDEISYDKYHADANRIYRIVYDRTSPEGFMSPRIATPGALKAGILREIPEVEQATHLLPSYWGKVLLSNETYSYYDANFLYADDSFFDVFSFQFIEGDAVSALSDPTSIVLTQSFAERFFGSNIALGQTLKFNKHRDLKVTGIIRDVPSQSHLQFDFLIPTLLLGPGWVNNWGEGHTHTYIKVRPQVSMPEVDLKIQHLLDTHHQQVMRETYFTQPLAGLQGIHLSTPRFHELTSSGNKLHIQVLLIVAFFVLLIAGINYINLATARSSVRAKEIAMRKVAGAFRKTLIYQFLVESILISMVAGLLAICIAESALPFFNNLTQKDLSLLAAGNQPVLGLIAIAVLVTGIGAGLYPAFYLSAFKPVAVFRKQHIGPISGFDLRKLLVISQFALSAFLMVGMFVVQQQMGYIQSATLGFDKDQVIVINNFGKVPKRDRNFVVRPKLEMIAGVKKVGAFNEMVGLQQNSSEQLMYVKGADNKEGVLWTHVGYNYLQTLGIPLVEGRYFSREFESDSTRHVVILSETAVRQLGVPEPVIGQQIISQHSPPRTVIGVVKDFHFTSLHNKIKPFVFGFTPNANALAVKLAGGDIQRTISQIKNTWAQFVPDVPMDFYFFDDKIDQLYRSEKNFQTIFSVMTGLTLIIACLGLIGLAAFTAQQRIKEIGIRKILGASITSLLTLLTREYMGLIVIANLIAWPIAHLTMKRWLENFAYRINIDLSVFLISSALALMVAMITIISLVYKAVVSNPINSLRNE